MMRQMAGVGFRSGVPTRVRFLCATQPLLAMNTHRECSLTCEWRGTHQCLCHLVSECILQSCHLGQSQLSGVRALYFPQELPPCIHPDGSLHWSEESPAEEEAAPHFGNDEAPDW